MLPENNFLPVLDAIPPETVRRARMLWLNYPNNPTAAVAGLDFFARAVDFCRRHDILLCHDAAYNQVTFDGYRAASVLEVPGAAQMWRLNSTPCRNPTTWPAGGWELRSVRRLPWRPYSNSKATPTAAISYR